MASSLKLGVTHWAREDALSEMVSEAFNSLGCQVATFLPTERIPAQVDFILIFGPFGSVVPIANQVLALPAARRPRLAVWMTEGLPRPDFPDWLRTLLSRNRAWVERLSYRPGPDGLWSIRTGWRRLTRNGFRYRYYGDLRWLRERGLLSFVATGSQWIAEFLRARGYDPLLAYYGLRTDPFWGEDLGLNRDIPVLWLGKMATDRRKNLLSTIRKRLAAHQIPIQVIDGVENPTVHGRERTVLLNRTKIILNLLRQPWDNNSIRFCLAGLNKVLVISEPTYPHLPLINGVHYIETPADQIANAVLHYLNHEAERRQLAEQGHHFVKDQLNVGRGAARILEKACQILEPVSPENAPKAPAASQVPA